MSLATLAAANGETLSGVAAAIGVRAALLERVDQGIQALPRLTAGKIAAHLGVDVSTVIVQVRKVTDLSPVAVLSLLNPLPPPVGSAFRAAAPLMKTQPLGFTLGPPGSFSTKSMTFDGVEEFLSLGTTAANFERTDVFSVSVWVKTSGPAAAFHAIVTKALSVSPFTGWLLEMSDTGRVQLVLRNTITTDELSVRTDTATVDDGDWHHVCATYDGSSVPGGVTIYIDGVAAATTTIVNTLASSILNGAATCIGAVNGAFKTASNSFWDGLIDEVALYDSELLPSEVDAIYNDGKPPNLLSSGPVANLSGWWRMGETLIAPTPFSTRSLALNGTDEFITVGSHTQLRFDFADRFSFSAWFNTSASAIGTIISKEEASGNFEGYCLLIDSTGEIIVRLEGSGAINNKIEVETFSTWNDGKWHHVAVTYDGSSTAAGVIIYIDGVAQAPNVTFDAASNSMLNTVPFQIGIRDNTDRLWDGLLDEVAVFNSELTPAQVAAIFNHGNPVSLVSGPASTGTLVGWWRMGENVTFGDSTTSLLLDGVNEFVQIGDVAALAFERTDAFSASAWIRTTTNVVIATIVAKRTVARGWELSLATGGRGVVKLTHTGGALEINVTTNALDPRINDGGWHHVLMTYDGSTLAAGVHIYIDGVDQTLTVNSDDATGTILQATSARIGYLGDNVNPFPGLLDEVAVWSKELTPAEAVSVFNGGAPTNLLSGPSSLVGYWRMGEGASFPTIPDLSVSGNDGTMTNMEVGDITSDAPAYVPDASPSAHNGSLANMDSTNISVSVASRFIIPDASLNSAFAEMVDMDPANITSDTP